jgi:DNA transposase THAP9
MVHAVKLLRNNLAKQEFFLHGDEKIEWRFYGMLECLQTIEGLHLGTRLTPRHIDFAAEKMKARLALEIFSESTASALEYLHKSEYPGFEDVNETVHFTRVVNDVFDIFNTKNLNSKYYKHPLEPGNAEIIFEKLDTIEEYIRRIDDKNGRLVFLTKIKTGFLGILINIHSLRNMYQR